MRFLSNARDALCRAASSSFRSRRDRGRGAADEELNCSILFRRKIRPFGLELAAGVMGCSVARPEDRNPTHKGFDFRRPRGPICERFVIETEILSPPPLPWQANSQVFFIAARPDAEATDWGRSRPAIRDTLSVGLSRVSRESPRCCKADHLTVLAPTLPEGVARARLRLGVDMPTGGAHPFEMGTHNRLLRRWATMSSSR